MNKLWDEGTFCIDKPKRKIRGIEIVRTSTPKVIREKLKEAIDIIFITKSNQGLIEYIEKFKKEFYNMSIEEISFPRSVKFSDYDLESKGLPVGVRSAFVFNKFMKDNNITTYQLIADGDKIKFCYIKQPNYLKSHVVGFMNKMPEEMKDRFKIDYEMQYQKSFLDPLTKLVSSIGWYVEEKNDLSEFFDFD